MVVDFSTTKKIKKLTHFTWQTPVFGIFPKDLSSIMDLPLNLVQFLGYNLMLKINETLTRDPQKVWQTLKNFDYP